MEDFKQRDDIYSQSVRAGKRTYFFDVKETKNGDYYLILTESKKRFVEGKNPFFEKHKVFLYKEDFQKFSDALQDAIKFIEENQPVIERTDSNYSDVEFEDLGD